MIKVTRDLSRKASESVHDHLTRIAKENYSLPGEAIKQGPPVQVLVAEEMEKNQPTAEELKLTKQKAKEAMQKLRPKR